MDIVKSLFNEGSSGKFFMDSAVIYTGGSYDQGSGKFIATGSLGATTGGVKVTIDQPMRQAEIDNVLIPVKGNDYFEGSGVTIEATMKEWSPANVKKAVIGNLRNALSSEAPNGYQIIEPKDTIEDADYLANLFVVGFLKGTNQPIIISIPWGINTAGLGIETANHGEAGIPVKIESRSATANGHKVGGDFKIYMPPEPVALTGFTISATSTVQVGKVVSLNPVFTPSNATNKRVVYSSSNTTKASVDNDGHVTGIATGSAVITAIAEDGNIVATCTVTVTV